MAQSFKGWGGMVWDPPTPTPQPHLPSGAELLNGALPPPPPPRLSSEKMKSSKKRSEHECSLDMPFVPKPGR